MQPPPESPVRANPVHSRAKEPSPRQLVQGNPKGKQVEQPIQGNIKGKQPEQLRPQEPVPVEPKGKQVEQPVRANLKGKQPEQPWPQQPVQAEPKGSLNSKQPEQAPPKGSKHPTVKGKEPQTFTFEQWLQLRPTLQPPPRKAILANARPVYLGCPKVFIARIPGDRNAKPSTMHPVKVSVIPDTAYRHPQTFFFKNIPDVERYWGILNDAATTAQRVVRLERDSEPTPYFLLVCRGEHPKPTSPRNDNAIFADMHEPIFGDAFVFRLADPEIDEKGYSRYANIDKDLGSIGWLPEAIRGAGMKVEHATASDANPGFPDMTAYADAETMLKDAQKMMRWMTAIRKADKKYGSALPVDAIPELPDIKKMKAILRAMTAQMHAWSDDDVLRLGRDPESSDFKTVQDFTKKALVAHKVIEENSNEVDAAMNFGLSDVKTKDAVERIKTSFRVASDAFIGVEATTKVDFTRQVIDTLTVDDIPAAVDLKALKQITNAMMVHVATWKRDRAFLAHAVSGPLGPDLFDEFAKKMQVACQAMADIGTESRVSRAIHEVNDAFQAIKAEVAKEESLPKVDPATARKADAATSSANPEMPDLPGHPGTSQYRVERFD